MSTGGYGLGIDIGEATTAVAACSSDGERCAQPLRLAPLPEDGQVGALLARVGDPVPVYVDGRPVPAADAVAARVTAVAERVAGQLGGPAARTVVTVPPWWSEHRRQALTEALHGAATLASSAVAVTRHGRATGTVPPASTVAVYDLGAGTLDTAVVRAGEDGGIAHVAQPPAPLAWGGRDVDDAVVRHVRGFLPTAPPTLRAACVAAKEALSTQTDVRVEVGGTARPVRLVREDLDELLSDAVAESVTVLRGAVAGAGLEPAQLDGIVLAGGSSRLPAVAEALSAELDRPVLVTAEPELAAACGAAELALDLLDAPAVPTAEPLVAAEPVVADDEEELTVDADDEFEPDEAEADELAERREHRHSAAGARIAVVAAMFLAILITPVTLLAALDSGVLATHGGGAANAADSPAATTPPSPDSPAAATGPTSAEAGTHRTAGSGTHATRVTSSSASRSAGRSTTAGRSTASRSSAASAATTAAAAPAAPAGTTTAAAPDPAPVTDPPVTNPPPVTDPPVANPPPVTDPPPATVDPPPPTTVDTAPPPVDPTPPPADPAAGQATP